MNLSRTELSLIHLRGTHDSNAGTLHLCASQAGPGRNQVHPDPARKLSANLYVLLRVQWKTPDDGQRNSPKHVEFYSKNKFEKLVHLVGCIIRIYHDARSSERQTAGRLITIFFLI